MTDYAWKCPECGATYAPARGLPEPIRVAEHDAWQARHEAGDHDDEEVSR